MPRFAANLSMLFPEVGFLDRFACASTAGFDAVECLFPYEHRPADLADRLAGHGLAQVLFNLPPGRWEAGERGLACLPERLAEFRESVDIAIEYARALGCSRLHVMAGIVAGRHDHDMLHATYVENLRDAADRAAPDGITLLIEPLNPRDMPGYYLNSVAMARDVIAEVGRPNLRLQADIYHLQRIQGELADTLVANRDIIGHVQIADTPGRHEPGTGEINYPFIFATLDRMGYAGWVGCEYRPACGHGGGLDWLAAWRQAAGSPPAATASDARV
jgi:hydroxypyruvate isomerase